MQLKQFRNSILYTTFAIITMGVVFMCLSVVVVRPLFDTGTPGSRIVYGIMGIALLYLIDPVRNIIRQVVHLLLQRRVTNYAVLEQQCISVFVEKADFFSTCADIKHILQRGFGVHEVQLVVKKDGQFQRVERASSVPLPLTHPLIQYWKTHEETQIGRPLPEELVGKMDTDIVYALPLSVEHRFIGWISFHDERRRTRFFLEDQIFLHDLQPLLSVAFQRLRIESTLEKRIDELLAINLISQTMNSSLHIKETLESIMDAVVHLADVDRALMYLSDDEGTFFTPVLGRGITDDVNMNFRVDMRKSVFQHVVATREPLVVEDINSDTRINKEYAAFVKTTSFIAIPIVYKERVVGIIGVDNRLSKRSITEVNVEMLVTLANHAATAIANSKLYERTQQFNDELQKKIAEATVHLQKLVDMKSHFLTVASHQLRTPTTIVRGLLSMLVEDPEMPPKEQRTFVLQAYSSMNRLERIISELLSATELEDHTIKPYVEDIDTEEFLQSIVNNLSPLAKERKITLSLAKSKKPIHIRSDRFKLQEAVSNLVDNAIRYTKEGSVTASVTISDGHVAFHVRDTGIGLSREDREVIFEKFRRGDQGIQVEPNGTGLGLYIVKRIIEILGGTIDVESAGRGKGSEFILTIPVEIAPSN